MDMNEEIYRELAHLRAISESLRGGPLHRSTLSDTIDAIIETITNSNNALYDVATYRERKKEQYANGLDYKAVKKLKITKEHIYALFKDPKTGQVPNLNRDHLSIEWCEYQPFKENWMDQWFMVFDHPPHNNREIPLYFYKKMYAEFVLKKHVNYFDLLQFQGVGRGMPQNHPGARLRDANRPIPPARQPLPRIDVPPTHELVPQTQRAFLTLAQAVARHGTVFEQMDEAGPSVSRGTQPPPPDVAGPSRTGGVHRPPPDVRVPSSSRGKSVAQEPGIEPHQCTSCGGPCTGGSLMTVDESLTYILAQIVGASPRVRQGFYDSDAPRPGPTQVPTLTETNSLQGQSTDTADYLTRGDYVIDSSEDFDIESIDVGDLEVPDVIVSSVATTQIEPPGGVYRPSFEFGSPDRPNVGKGLVYSRESTPRKIFRVDQGIASPPPQSPFVDTAQGSSMVDLTRVVEAGVSAAEAMARSDIEPSPTIVPGPSSEVDIQPTAPSATQTPEMHTSPRQRHDRPQSGKNKRKIDF